MSSTALESLRSSAARAAELCGDGFALILSLADDGDAGAGSLSLRAAAGFPDADSARRAAHEVAEAVQEAAASPAPLAAPPLAACGERGAAGTWLLPLRVSGRARGVLAVSHPSSLDSRSEALLSQAGASAALALDHAVLEHRIAELEKHGPPSPASRAENGEEGDELLRLSEQLFEQDIELMRRDEKLGKIEKLKNDFIEKMSRELRTPLNSIIEAVIGVIANESDQLSTASLGSLRHALDEGTAFQRTLHNILDLWRIKQHELPTELQEVNFAEVVEEAIFSVQDTLGSKPVRIEKHFEQPLPKVRTDLNKVNQILFLLLDNAAKFTNRGQITIAPRLEGDELFCEVRDTGIGICPDDQELVFDEFFQVDDMASARYRGAGLGLTLVRDLVSLLGGELQLESEAGKGTSVSFRLPVQAL